MNTVHYLQSSKQQEGTGGNKQTSGNDPSFMQRVDNYSSSHTRHTATGPCKSPACPLAETQGSLSRVRTDVQEELIEPPTH